MYLDLSNLYTVQSFEMYFNSLNNYYLKLLLGERWF